MGVFLNSIMISLLLSLIAEEEKEEEEKKRRKILPQEVVRSANVLWWRSLSSIVCVRQRAVIMISSVIMISVTMVTVVMVSITLSNWSHFTLFLINITEGKNKQAIRI